VSKTKTQPKPPVSPKSSPLQAAKPGDFIRVTSGIFTQHYLVKRVTEKDLIVTNIGYDYNTHVAFSTGLCNGAPAGLVTNAAKIAQLRREHTIKRIKAALHTDRWTKVGDRDLATLAAILLPSKVK